MHLTDAQLANSVPPPPCCLAGFVGEVKHKYNVQMSDVFRETFCWLPLGFVINKKVLVVSPLCLMGGLRCRGGWGMM